jgi:trans-aconitate 2-methyltransferase
MPRDWDAATYDRIADPMTRWGAAVLDRLPLAGDERVLDALFRNLGQALRPGGRLVAQCGGVGNIASVQTALAQLGVDRDGTYFATPAETERRLAASGFVDARAWLQPEPTPFDSAEALGTYLATIVIRAPLAALPEPERPAFVRAVVKRLPRLQIDYVRLNIVARRAL